MIRKLIRRIVVWALADSEIKIECGAIRCSASDLIIRGVSTPEGRSVIVKQLKIAKANREL